MLLMSIRIPTTAFSILMSRLCEAGIAATVAQTVSLRHLFIRLVEEKTDHPLGVSVHFKLISDIENDAN
jgi:hypothetical protein